nr:hypothetical protein [Caballeronia catudaia]
MSREAHQRFDTPSHESLSLKFGRCDEPPDFSGSLVAIDGIDGRLTHSRARQDIFDDEDQIVRLVAVADEPRMMSLPFQQGRTLELLTYTVAVAPCKRDSKIVFGKKAQPHATELERRVVLLHSAAY